MKFTNRLEESSLGFFKIVNKPTVFTFIETHLKADYPIFMLPYRQRIPGIYQESHFVSANFHHLWFV